MNRLFLIVAGTAVLFLAVFLVVRSSIRSVPKPVFQTAASSGIIGEVGGEGMNLERHRLRKNLELRVFAIRAQEIAMMPRDSERESAVAQLAREWVLENPAAAERWAASLEDTADVERAMTHVCIELAKLDPRGAIEMARGRGLQQGTLTAIVGVWAETNFEGARSWLGELPVGKFRDEVALHMIISRAGNEPADAARMAAETMLPLELEEEAAIAVLHQWRLLDAKAAHRWVETFPAGQLKDRAIHEIASSAQ